MASKARDLSNFISVATVDASEIASNAVTADKIADVAVTHAKLHTDMNLSGKTLTFATNQISGNAIDGGVISNFTSTGIDDNSSAVAVTILSDGKVGIGETAPDGRLHIKGGTATNDKSHILFENTAGSKVFAIGGGSTGISNNDLFFRNVTDNTRPMVITDTGRVGIGTDSPAGKLNVVSTAHNNGAIFDSTGTAQLWLRDTDAGSNQKNWGFQISGGDFNIIRANDDRASGFVTPIYMQQAPNNSLVINSSGHIGFGGNIELTGGGTVSSNGASDTVVLSGSTAVNLGGNITLHGQSHANASQIFFKNGSTNVMSVASGKVLVGTTSNNYNRGKLTIFGTPGNPATTGTNIDNVAIRVATNAGNSQAMDIGIYNAAPYGAWLQASNSGSLQSFSPIILNPNGGSIGIGIAAPTAPLQVGTEYIGRPYIDVLGHWKASDDRGDTQAASDGGGMSYTHTGSVVKMTNAVGSHSRSLGQIRLTPGKYYIVLTGRPTNQTHGWTVFGTNSNGFSILIAQNSTYSSGYGTNYINAYLDQTNKDQTYAFSKRSGIMTVTTTTTYGLIAQVQPYVGGGYQMYVTDAKIMKLS